MLARLVAMNIILGIYDAERTPKALKKEVNVWLVELGHPELVF